jgi:hypothetical protein
MYGSTFPLGVYVTHSHTIMPSLDQHDWRCARHGLGSWPLNKREGLEQPIHIYTPHRSIR